MAMDAPMATIIPTHTDPTAMATHTDPALDAQRATLTLTQWLSPAFPVGAFTYSHGLEAAVHAGWVTDAASLCAWLEDLVTLGSGHTDALFVAAAYHGAEPLRALDDAARAFAPSAERAREAHEQGRALAAILDPVWGTQLSGLTYPVALGAAAARESLDLDLTLTLFLQGFVTNLTAAAQRLAPIGQTEAQALIRDLSPRVAETARSLHDGDLACLASAAFLSDIASMRHETQHSRIFRS